MFLTLKHLIKVMFICSASCLPVQTFYIVIISVLRDTSLTPQSFPYRCIKPELKSLALGIHTLATRTLGENHLLYSVHYISNYAG